MATYTWISGALDSTGSWQQPDPENPAVPGSNDEADINGAGTLTGGIGPRNANLNGTFDLTGSIVSVETSALLGGALTIENGASFGGGTVDITAGSVTQNGGTVSATGGGELLGSAAVAISYKQVAGTNTATLMEFNSGTYELDTGAALTVTASGGYGEYIGDANGATATFTQKGGTNTIQNNSFMLLGYFGTGIYTMTAGTLTAPIEYIGQNGSGTFTQTGGKATVANRIVLGIDQNSGTPQFGNGSYTLGGTGSLSVQTIFIGSDAGCTGTFDFDAKTADKATLAVSGTGGYPGLIVGGQGTGTFTQGHGSVSTTIAVGFRSTGIGTYNFQTGSVTSTDEEIGVAGKGTFVQTLGTNTVTKGDLIVGNASGSNGTYQALGGSVKISIGNLTIGAQAGSTGDFEFNATPGDTATLTLTKGSITVGDGGTGIFTIAGGGFDAGLTLGSQTGSEGTFNLNAGALASTDADEVIGDAGTGTITQIAGTNTIDNGGLFIGNSGGDGTYNLGGKGALKLTGSDFQIAVGGGSTGTFNFNTKTGDKGTLSTDTKLIEVGVHGKGTFIQGGGTVGAKLVVGGQVGSTGTFELDAGTVSAKGQVVGNNGAGTFNMNGGTDKLASGDLILGAFAAGGGTFNFNSGKLSDGGELIGYAGVGHFTQSGGTNAISGAGSLLDIGTTKGSVGTFTLKKGTLITIQEVVGDAGTGTFTQSGGTNTVTGNVTIGKLGTGTFALTGGTTTLKTAKGAKPSAVVLGVEAGSTGTLSVTKAKLTTPTLVIGGKGQGQVTAGAGGTIAVTTSVTIFAGSTLSAGAGIVDIGTIKAPAKTIGVGTGGKLIGAGIVAGALKETSKGSVKASGGVLTIAGAVSGGGTLSIADHATLDLTGKDGNAVAFLGAKGILKLEKTASVAGNITKLQIGDMIDIADTTITKAKLSGTTLTLTNKAGGTITLHVTATLTGAQFTLQGDGHGGTDVVVSAKSAASAPLGLFGQYVAAGLHSSSRTAPGTASVFGQPHAIHLDLAAGHG